VRLALARPDVGFRLLAEGRSLIDAPPEQGDDPRGRLGRILGRPVADRLFPIVQDPEPRRIKVHGFVAAPDVSERTSRGLYVFVNGRFVRERTAQHAIQEAYRPLLEKGRYPVVVLFLELDPRTLDVNVHPQKTEVRFQSSTDVHRAITAALGRTLQPAPWLARHLGPAPAPERVYRLADPTPSGLHLDEPRGNSPSSHGPAFMERARSLHPPPRPPAFDAKARGRYVPDLGFGFGLRDRDPNPVLPLPNPGGPEEPTNFGDFSALEPIGQALGAYLVCQAPGRLVLIDQQVAHERIGFARLKAAQAKEATAIQPLLVPLTLELDPTRARTMEAERGRLLAVGFEVEPFGGVTWLLKTAPAALGGVELAPLLIDLLDELAAMDAATPLEERLDRLLLRSARHAAIKSGVRLTPEEIRALLRQLDQIGAPGFGSQERPLFLEWTAPELARLFYKS
jgi:DNA mismatch repair protein MutL